MLACTSSKLKMMQELSPKLSPKNGATQGHLGATVTKTVTKLGALQGNVGQWNQLLRGIKGNGGHPRAILCLGS
jgi:hypothetical protein